MDNTKDVRLVSPTVQDTATPTCTHRGFTALLYKINYQFIINDNLNLNDAIYQIQKLEKEKEN
jgi:hypothetical protein